MSRRSRRAWATLTLAAALAAAPLAAPLAAGASEFDPFMADCELRYNASGWSFVYRTMKGPGQITCNNGQKADVEVELRAVGFTAGRSEIIGGTGNFTQVRDISELMGSYAQMGAHGGMTGSGEASVLTKGVVSLALSGTGNGMDLGVTIGTFRISPRP